MTFAEFTNLLGFKFKDGDVQKVNNTFSQIRNTATKMLGAIGIGFSLSAMNALVEEFARVKDQIQNSTSELGDQAEIQQKILAAASATRSAYSDTAKMVSNLVHENSELFGSVDEAIKFNNAATMLFKTAGKTNEDIAGLMEAINKSFAKGYVDSETLSQLLERSPEAVELLNKKLGTTSDQLEQMATDGKFTVADLKAAFVDSADEIEAKFGNVKMTVTDAITVIRNKWGLWLADTNETLEVTQTISRVMVNGFDAVLRALTRVRNGVVWLSEKLGGVENLYKLIALTAGTAFGYVALGKVLEFIWGIKKLHTAVKTLGLTKALEKLNLTMLKTRLRMLGVIAIFILIALLVEDFFAFMDGRDSLFGTLLEKAGVDCDKFRENVRKIWTNIKTVLSSIWLGIKNVCIPVFQGIWKVIKSVFGAIGKVIGTIVPKFAELIDQIANGQVDTKSWTEIGETIGMIASAIAIAIPLILAIEGAIKAWSIIQGVLNAVMNANPITWIIMGILLLIAVIILLIKNWDKVKAAAAKCWDWIKGIWASVANWFKSSVIDPIVGFFTGLWDSIKSIFAAVGEWFSGVFTAAWEGIKNAFSSVISFFQGIWEGIKAMFTTIGLAIGDGISGAFKSVVNSVINFASKVINGFIDAINWAIDVINKIPGVSISKLQRIELQGLAQGGYIGANNPTPVVIGDNRNEGEIVSPISKMRDTVVDALYMFASASKPKGSAQMLGNSAVNKSVVQNIEINNQFHGDKAIQQHAAKTMDKSASDITSELARGLAYAR